MRYPLFVLLTALTLTVSGNAHAAGLNDTGITDCFNDSAVVTTGVEADSGTHPRQDCRYGRDAAVAAGTPKVGGGGKGFDFSKIANNGSELPESAALGSGPTDWACTRDNVTGLIWDIKTTSGLRSQSHSYSWYNRNSATNGGSAGSASAGFCATSGRCDTEKFVADVNTGAGLCGAADWRMPTQNELISIVDFGVNNPSIDPTYFPNTFTSNFWSASASASGSGYAWAVSFISGIAFSSGAKYYNFDVRLVRAGQ